MPTQPIVVAEDDEDDRMLIKNAFAESRIGTPVHFVNDGELLMEYLRRRGSYEKLKNGPNPALILLDLNMPRKSGTLVLEEIRSDANLKNIPVVVFTTSRSDEIIDTVYSLGANSFVIKPSSFERLCEIMKILSFYWTNIVAAPPPCRS